MYFKYDKSNFLTNNDKWNDGLVSVCESKCMYDQIAVCLFIKNDVSYTDNKQRSQHE